MDNRSVEKDLYHRSPYLLIDKIQACDEKKVIALKELNGDEFFFRGHFPNAPILPGALMQEMTTQAAGVIIARYYNPMGSDYDTENFDPNRPALGVLSRVKEAKYKNFARPKDALSIEVELIESLPDFFEFKGKITKTNNHGSKVIMTNHFCLTNIPSSLLLED
jgi:3-hydroxyacyl-[acyl-carrier-protein] dehydratase